MTELVIPAPVVNEVRETVLREDGNEWFTFLYCGQSDDRLLATDHRPVSKADHITQARGGCRVDPQVEVDRISTCVSSFDRVPCLIHSHPFAQSTHVGFSSLDEEMMRDMTDWFASAFPEESADPVFVVVGQQALRAGRYDQETEAIEHLPVTLLGEWALDRPLALPEAGRWETPDAPNLSTERHDRTMRALTEAGTKRLAASRVGIVSAGGIGSILVEQLTRLGVGDLVVVDPDVVEESNLNRLHGAFEGDVGQPKVDVMQRHAKQINPSINIDVHQARAQDVASSLKTCDVLVAGVDQVSARMWLNEFAVRHLIPYVDAGTLITSSDDDESVEAMEGFIQTIVPGVTGCFDCLDRGDPEQARIEGLTDEELEAEIEDGYVDGSELTPEPAVVHLNGLVASKAVDSVVKLLTRFDKPTPFIHYEGLTNQFEAVQTRPSAACLSCSADGVLGDGDIEWDLETVDSSESSIPGAEIAPSADGGSIEPADVFGETGSPPTAAGNVKTDQSEPASVATEDTGPDGDTTLPEDGSVPTPSATIRRLTAPLRSIGAEVRRDVARVGPTIRIRGWGRSTGRSESDTTPGEPADEGGAADQDETQPSTMEASEGADSHV